MLEELRGLVAETGQEHLLRFWDDLNEKQQAELAEQIRAIDFPLIHRLFQEQGGDDDIQRIADQAAEPPAYLLGEGGGGISADQAKERGVQSLAAGQVGVILVAGGQGTRLGFEHPKGMYPIGPISEKSIFQIHVEKIVAASRRYGVAIPLCLMTSPATHDETTAYFAENDRFGLAEEDLMVFCQGTMPAVDAATGKILLADRHQLALSPDGHGGTLAALVRSGILDKLESRGIEQLFYFQVDNPLVDIGSPEFLGYHLLSGSQLTSQVVRKNSAQDRVGNVVQVDGRLHVIEYSDLPDEVAERRNTDGSLQIWAGSIAVHGMDVAFLRSMAASSDALPFHYAGKKVPFVDSSGERVAPDEPNAIKFERFIFDLLPSAANAIVVEVDPAEHFAPLKNASGAAEDTPESVKAQISSLHAGWLTKAGVTVGGEALVEISPLRALDAGETKEKLAKQLEPGASVDESMYFGESTL